MLLAVASGPLPALAELARNRRRIASRRLRPVGKARGPPILKWHGVNSSPRRRGTAPGGFACLLSQVALPHDFVPNSHLRSRLSLQINLLIP